MRRIAFLLWNILKSPNLWSGFFPAVVLGVLAFFALQQTNKQIALTSEQTSHIRKPVLMIEAQPNFESGAFAFPQCKLFLSNVGNKCAENVYTRMFLLLVTDSQVFSYGQHKDVRTYLTDTTRTPKEKIWPRLTLCPDQEIEITDRIQLLFFAPYLTRPPDGDQVVRQDFITIRDSIGGDYVLFVECSYRRPIDLEIAADTSWFSYPYILGSMDNLSLQVGGPGIIDRAKVYLQRGPQVSINIQSTDYEIYRHTSASTVTMVKKIPRLRSDN